MTLQEMKERKREKGYTYAQLAALSGVPEPTIQKIFTGQTKSPRYSTLCALEKALSESSHAILQEEAAFFVPKAPANSDTLSLPAYPSQGSYTLEDYYALPEDVRAELIDGVLYNMTAPTPFHQLIAAEMHGQIRDFIRSNNGSCIPFISPIDVQLNRDNRTMVQPDLIIICHPEIITDKNIFGVPDFVLEVLSPSTRKKDLIRKYSKYSDAGVREYWIIDPYKKNVIVNFFEDKDFSPVIYPIDADIPVNIYSGKLIINLSSVLQWLPKP